MFFIPQAPIAPTNIYAGCIYEYENIWMDTKEVISGIEKELSNPDNLFGFEKATTINNSTNERTNAHMGITKAAQQNEFFRELNNRFYMTLIPTVEHYRQTFLDDCQINYNSEPYNLLKYKSGTEYKAHYDGATITRRAVSPILYLNDDYTGGELEFTNFNLKIKPKAGSLYIFPSSFPYRHIAHPVETGTKYAIVTWLHDGV